jgi:hypothetical protein
MTQLIRSRKKDPLRGRPVTRKSPTIFPWTISVSSFRAAAITLFSILSLCSQGIPSIQVEGEPVITESEIQTDEEEILFRYRVWLSESIWHIDWESERQYDRFHGEILVNGPGNFVDVYSSMDTSLISLTWKSRHVKFDTTPGTPGGNIDLYADCESLIFKLYVNTDSFPEHIFIGENARNPLTIPFILHFDRIAPEETESSAEVFLPQSILWGKPEMHELRPTGYFIWKDTKGEWHLHMKSTNPETFFEGEITVGEKAVLHLSGRGEDMRWLTTKPRSLSFSAYPGIEGLSLAFTTDSTAIQFDLTVNGKRMEELIYIGEKGSNPSSVPFNAIHH